MNIRPIQETDRAQYLQMAAEFYDTDSVIEPIPAAYIERTFDQLCAGNPQIAGWILEDEGETAGYVLGAVTYSQEAGGTVLWLEELYIRPVHRGRGLAHFALEQVPKHFPAARYRLEVMPGHDYLWALYASHGFEEMPYRQMYKTTE